LDKKPAEEITNYEDLLQIPEVVTLEPGRSGKIKPTKISQEQRINTANAILEANPDILAVEEVENLTTLRLFNDKYMDNAFDQIVLLDGNDARGIDVGLLIKKQTNLKILEIRSHADEAIDGSYLKKSNRLNTQVTGQAIFSRDCLEVDVQIENSILTLLVNHFKAQDTKPASKAKRERQAKRVATLAKLAKMNKKVPVVLGDLNIDTQQDDYDSSLDPLFEGDDLYDAFSMVNANERWTHYYSTKHEVSRLDYILIDHDCVSKVCGVEIMRKGLPIECKQYSGKHLASMDGNDLAASDHCPTTIVVEF